MQLGADPEMEEQGLMVTRPSRFRELCALSCLWSVWSAMVSLW